jgi:hypothetical protein
MINREDEEHLRAAAASRRAVFTFNTGDYCALHQLWASEGRTHAGIVVSLFKPDAFANFTDSLTGKPGFRLIESAAPVRQCTRGRIDEFVHGPDQAGLDGLPNCSFLLWRQIDGQEATLADIISHAGGRTTRRDKPDFRGRSGERGYLVDGAAHTGSL